MAVKRCWFVELMLELLELEEQEAPSIRLTMISYCTDDSFI